MKPMKFYMACAVTSFISLAELTGITGTGQFFLPDHIDTVYAADPATTVTNETEFISAAAAGGNIIIGADFECYRKIEVKNNPVNINLNGHTVTLNLSMDINNNAVITGNGTFNNGIFVEKGRLTVEGGDIKGMIILSDLNSEFYMKGGRINCIDQHGGYSKMSGGEISNSTSNGVNLSFGRFEMTGGKITNNSSSGVHLWASDEDNNMYDHKFIMNGGEIINNSYRGVSCAGGGQIIISGGKIARNTNVGLFARDSSITMSNGTISGNKGGGVRLNEGNVFTMTGGKIIDNINEADSSSHGGVRYSTDDIFKISGSPVITGNTNRNIQSCNVELDYTDDSSVHKNKQIELSGPLSENCRIGIYACKDLDFTKNYKTYHVSNNPSSYFFSDINDLSVVQNSSSGEVRLTKQNSGGSSSSGSSSSSKNSSSSSSKHYYEDNDDNDDDDDNSSGSSSFSEGDIRTAGKGSSRADYVKTGTDTVRYYAAMVSNKTKRAKVPASVKIRGKAYRVTSIASGAFEDCNNIKEVIVGGNVKKIYPSAFKNSGIKVIILNTKMLSKGGVKGCLTGSAVKTIKAPESKVDDYKKIFTKSNAGKKVKVTKK